MIDNDYWETNIVWVNASPLKQATKNTTIATINDLQLWDDQVASNSICRTLRTRVTTFKLGEDIEKPGRAHVAISIQKLFAIVPVGDRVNNTHRIPASFRNWGKNWHKYWYEVLNDVERLLAKNILHTEHLKDLIVSSAIVFPPLVKKRTAQLYDNVAVNTRKKIKMMQEAVGKGKKWPRRKFSTTIAAAAMQVC